MEKWSIDQGNLMSVTARKHRLELYLRSKDRQLLRNIAKKSVITTSKLLKPKKSADSNKDNYGNRNWNFRCCFKITVQEMNMWLFELLDLAVAEQMLLCSMLCAIPSRCAILFWSILFLAKQGTRVFGLSVLR